MRNWLLPWPPPGGGNGLLALINEGLVVDRSYQDAAVSSALFLRLLAQFDSSVGYNSRPLRPPEAKRAKWF